MMHGATILCGHGGLGDAVAWQKAALVTKAAASVPIPDPTTKAVVTAIAVVTGLIAKSRTKVDALKAQNQAGVVANQELRLQSIELDKMIVDATVATNQAGAQVAAAGLNGFFDWIKETVTPNRTVGAELTAISSEHERLVAEVENKIGVLETLHRNLQDMYDQITGGKFKKVAIIGAGVVAGGLVLYYTAKHFNWI